MVNKYLWMYEVCLRIEKAVNKKYKRIVVKVGSALITHNSDSISTKVMTQLIKQIDYLMSNDIEVILVSSGAVAAGKQVLNSTDDSTNVKLKQVFAAVGQSVLVNKYSELFENYDLKVAQTLLTRADIINKVSYLNFKNTLLNLLMLGVVPIVNENDVVAIDELVGIHFGDNDTLSAMVSKVVDADLLILLGELDGLYTSDPNIDPTAKLVRKVENISDDILNMGSGSIDSKGQGGMITKIDAAKVATTSGVDVIIASGLEKNILTRLVGNEDIGTWFPASITKIESKKKWMLSQAVDSAVIKITDKGAKSILGKSEDLLSREIIQVIGTFSRGDIVSIANPNSKTIALGIVNYNVDEIAQIIMDNYHENSMIQGSTYGNEVIYHHNMVINL